MLNTWLAWLKTGVGTVGIVLVLSHALYASANTDAPNGKTSTFQRSDSKSSNLANTGAMAGARIDSELATVPIPATPDFAVRQLAAKAVAASGGRIQNPTLNSRVAPGQIDTYTSSPSNTYAALPGSFVSSGNAIPGLFIGNSDVELSADALPKGVKASDKKVVPLQGDNFQAVAAAPAIEPFPVFTPDQIPQISAQPVVARSNASSSQKMASVPDALKQMIGDDAPRGKRSKLDPDTLTAVLDRKIQTPTIDTANATPRGVNLRLDVAQVYANNSPSFDLPGVVTTIENPLATASLMESSPTAQAIAPAPEKVVKVSARTAPTAKSQTVSSSVVPSINFRSATPSWEERPNSTTSSMRGLVLGQPGNHSVPYSDLPATSNKVEVPSFIPQRIAGVEGHGVN
jgi:hypothetical protein